MPLQPYKIDRFGGLNLRDDPTEIGAAGAVALQNVDLDRPGRIRTRDGCDKFNTTTGTGTAYTYLVPFSATQLLAIRPDTVNAEVDSISTSGVRTELGSGSTTIAYRFDNPPALLGTQASGTTDQVTRVFFGGATTTDAISSYDGTTLGTVTFSTGFGLTASWYVAAWPTVNRLVIAGSTTAGGNNPPNGSPATVYFTDPGDPATIQTSNYVILRPGDGEEIRGVQTWQDQVFVFKDTAVFVFYGTSTDATGLPIFSYRPVDLPDAISGPMVTGEDGVYFSTAQGIYRTQGGTPQRISDDLGTALFATPPTAMSYANGRLYVTIGDSAYVWDRYRGAWMIYSFSGLTAPRAFTEWNDEIYFASGLNVYKFDSALDDDDGQTLSWSYQSGWYDVSGVDCESTSLYSTVRGTGTVSVELLNDFNTVGWSGAQSVTLGTAPAIDEGYADGQGDGVLYSHKLSGTGAAVVTGLTHWIRHVRTTGLRSG